LAEGYLLFKIGGVSMSRKYFALYGKTLSNFNDYDDYENKPMGPTGVFHVTGSSEWAGKVGVKIYPNGFQITTLEGKTLCCSAPIPQDVSRWITAVQIGITMQPMSPGRAMKARGRKIVFTSASSIQKTRFELPTPVANDEENTLSEISATEEDMCAIVEGYLVKKSHFVPNMKKKYCVLSQIEFMIFDSHTDYESHRKPNGKVEIASVTDWDGHTSLLHYKNGFEIDTVQHSRIFCSAANEKEKHRWITGLRAALAKHRVSMAHDSSTSDQQTTSTLYQEGEKDIEEFHHVLDKYFAEHNPEKMKDIDTLLELYRGREKHLLEHLDMTYGTELSKDAGQMLQKYHNALEKKACEDSNATPRVEGVLKKQDHKFSKLQEKYCVLSGNSMTVYNSSVQMEMDDACAQYTVLNFEEWDGHSSLLIHRVMHGIKIFANNGHEYLCDASTESEKKRWLIGLRRGLGWARAHQQNSQTDAVTLTKHHLLQEVKLESPSPASSKVHSIEQAKQQQLRKALQLYYSEHNRSKQGEVDTLLSYFEGNELELLQSLDKTYDTNLCKGSEAHKIVLDLQKMRTVIQKRASLNDRVHMESYLSTKSNQFGLFSRYYFVLEDTTLNSFHSFDLSQRSSEIPTLIDKVIAIADWKQPVGFRFELQHSGTLFCEANSPDEKSMWISRARLAIAKCNDLDHKTDPNEENEAYHHLCSSLIEFFQQHNPSKVVEIPSLLRAYQGHIEDLLSRLDTIYNTSLAHDSTLLSLAKEWGTSSTNENGDQANEGILMEGYVLKRGHLMPSMRKRYCELRGNEYSFYDTHEDAKSDHVPPHGKVRIVSVVEWAGKTAAHKYQHGFEFDTEDHKTYFCAAYTKEDKTHWLHAIRAGIAMARGGAKQENVSNGSIEQTIRSLLEKFYAKHNPSRKSDIEPLIEYYKGHEADLFTALDKNYGTDLMHDPKVIEVLQQLKNALSPDEAIGVSDCSGYLFRKNTGMIRTQKVYAVIPGRAELNFYSTREGHKAGILNPHDVLKILNVSEWPEHTFGFQVGALEKSQEHTIVYFEAESLHDQQKWIKSLQMVLDEESAEQILREELEEQENPENTTSTLTHAHQGYLQSRDWKLPTLSEHYMEWEPPTLRVFCSKGVEKQLSTEYTVLALMPWNGDGVLHECHFPFELKTVNMASNDSVSLYMNAATKADFDTWTNKIEHGLIEVRAEELLQEQGATVGSSTDGDQMNTDPSCDFEGYITAKTSGLNNLFGSREIYCVLTGTRLVCYDCIKDAKIRSHSKLDIEIKNIYEWAPHSNDMKDIGFQLQTNSVTLYCHVSSKSLKHKWISKMSKNLNLARGEALLRDKEYDFKASPTPNEKAKHHHDKEVTVQGATMEGYLQGKAGSVGVMKSHFCALITNFFCMYSSDKAAASGEEPIARYVPTAIRDWHGKDILKQYKDGFRIIFSNEEHEWFFNASSTDEKQYWMSTIHEALTLAFADQFLDDTANDSRVRSEGVDMQSYMRIKHGHLSVLKEQYGVLQGPWLSIYETKEDFEHNEVPKIKMEASDVDHWHGDDMFDSSHHGISIETLDHGVYECCFTSQTLKETWMERLKAGIEQVESSEFISRDTSLKAIPGAAMEGYLKKKGLKFRAFKTRYCVLVGTQLLYYENQSVAISNGMPLGVFELTRVLPWQRKDDLFDVLTDRLEKHGFIVSTTTDRVVQCCAANTAEKQLWMKAIQSVLDQMEASEQGITMAMEEATERHNVKQKVRHRYAELKTENNRESSTIARLLKQSYDNDVEDDDDDDDDDEHDEHDNGEVSYIDKDPEMSPVKRTPREESQTLAAVRSSRSLPFWKSFCMCLYRPPNRMALIEAILTEEQKKQYSVDFYESGLSDDEL